MRISKSQYQHFQDLERIYGDSWDWALDYGISLEISKASGSRYFWHHCFLVTTLEIKHGQNKLQKHN